MNEYVMIWPRYWCGRSRIEVRSGHRLRPFLTLLCLISDSKKLLFVCVVCYVK